MSLEQNFENVLMAARTGAEWAWSSVYREFSPGLLRYLRARGAQNPEDTLGEIFIQVVKNLHRFEGTESDFKAWLFTIAQNRLIDEARSRTRRPAETPLDALPEPSEAGDPTATRTTSTSARSSPDDLTIRRLHETLAHLTSEQRDVLFLRVLAGLTIEETAQVLGKTSGSVKRLQSRGLKSLRRKIADGVVSL